MSVPRRLVLRTYKPGDLSSDGVDVYRSNGRWVIETVQRGSRCRNGERWSALCVGLPTAEEALADWKATQDQRYGRCVPVRRDHTHGRWTCRCAGFINC